MTEKGRAGGERDAGHRARARVVMLANEAERVGEDRLLVLDHVVGRQPALAAPAAHRSPRGLEPDAEIAGGGDLDVDEARLAAGEEIEMVGGRGAAGQQQLAEADPRGGVDRIRRRPAPHLVELGEPGEERGLLHAGDVAGEGLRKVVVRVDEAGEDDLAPGVDRALGIEGRRGLAGACGRDRFAVDHHVPARVAAALVVHGHDQPRVADQGAHRAMLPRAARPVTVRTCRLRGRSVGSGAS